MGSVTFEKFTAEVYMPTDHVGSFELEFEHDDGRLVGARVNGAEVGLEAARILHDAVTGRTAPRP